MKLFIPASLVPRSGAAKSEEENGSRSGLHEAKTNNDNI